MDTKGVPRKERCLFTDGLGDHAGRWVYGIAREGCLALNFYCRNASRLQEEQGGTR